MSRAISIFDIKLMCAYFSFHFLYAVEKAALVFSLKLESGHKLLCPWIDNSCDEKLASFAPMTAPVLADHYKERSSELLQLSALPVISGSVFEKMRSPQLEHFLKQLIAVECGAAPNDSSWTEFIGNDVEVVSSDLYYQVYLMLCYCAQDPCPSILYNCSEIIRLSCS